MKALAVMAIAIGGLIGAVGVAANGSAAPAAAAGYTVFCSDAGDDGVVAVKIPSDRSSPDRLHGVELYKQQHPGGRCFVLREHHD
jgi:hypothetical protein